MLLFYTFCHTVDFFGVPFSLSLHQILRRMSKPFWILLFTFVVGIPFWYMVVIYNADSHPVTVPAPGTAPLAPMEAAPVAVPVHDIGHQAAPVLQVEKPSYALPSFFAPEKKAPVIARTAPKSPHSEAATAAQCKAQAPVSWSNFVHSSYVQPTNAYDIRSPAEENLYQCGADVLQELAKPGLSEPDYQWCEWALSPGGGKVQVGKSFGKLESHEREKFENLNCNNVAKKLNPSCDDGWGDAFINRWKSTKTDEMCGDPKQYTSKVKCMDSSSTARFCIYENAMMDFSKMHDISRPGRSTGSRKWDPGFLATHCDKAHSNIGYFEFYQPAVNPTTTQCDYIVNETVIAYSHDDIQNLGHTMSDLMNVWAMLWLSEYAQFAHDIHFLNIDALRQGHNYNDVLSPFGLHYEKGFGSVWKANDFAKKGSPKVCFKHLIMQPRPVILFTWHGWWHDVECTFKGPSSLFQRWNLQMRRNYGLLQEAMPTNERIQVLLVVRSARAGGGTHQSTRVFANKDEVQAALALIPGVELVVQDLATISFEEQVRLVGNSTMVIGMHGAGIPHSMHMAVGTKYCCGVIEIFPEGEFKTIRGYGNMARRMGHYYERLALEPNSDRGATGTYVKPDTLTEQVVKLLDKIKAKASCVLPGVINDPYFA